MENNENNKNNNKNTITTSFLLLNLHCPSCVSHIQETLFALYPRPLSVSPSLVSSIVTVTHDISLSVHDIQQALEDVGFEVSHEGDTASAICPNGKDEDVGYLDRFLRKPKSNTDHFTLSQRRQVEQHINHCESCLREALHPTTNFRSTSSFPEKTNVADDDSTNPPPPIRAISSDTDKMADDRAIPLVVVDSGASSDLFRASVAIGGMTCAACVSAITEQLNTKPWVRSAAINLISNSATIDFVGVEHKDEVVATIEDIGYDATLDSIVGVSGVETEATETNPERTVQVLVEGMYCVNCPENIGTALATYGDRLHIGDDFSHKQPILKITYTPQVPQWTIRQIIQTISAVDPLFKVTVYHPPTLEERSRQIQRAEQIRLGIRVLVSLIVAIPTLIIGIVYMSLVSHHNNVRMFLMHPLRAGVSRAQWALFIMATPVYFFCADVFHKRTIKEIQSLWRPGSMTPILRRFYRFGSMNMLMSLGTSIAYISSVAQLIVAGVHPSLEVSENSFYFDSVVFLTFFLLFGRLIESYSKSKTGDAVAMLGKLRPTTALLVVAHESNSEQEATTDEETVETIDVDLLELGDTVRILHGGSPPSDGTITQGDSKFDESSLTGESRPIQKNIGDEVYAGTINKGSPVLMKIVGAAGTSMLDQIVKTVREGQTRRAPMERLADQLTAYFVPFITLCAILTWIIWLALGLSGTLPQSYLDNDSGGWVAWSLGFSIAVFVVACPCGLALAAPTALFVGGGLAAKHGILARGGGEAFEKASKLSCIVFDKTGTLTMGGEPVVTNHQVFAVTDATSVGKDKNWILNIIRSVEGNSSHIVAKAIVTLCNATGSAPTNLVRVEEIAGKGMKALFSLENNVQAEVLVGNESLLTDESVLLPHATQTGLNLWKSQGKSVALAAIKFLSSLPAVDTPAEKWQIAAIFAISDPIRPEAPVVIKALKERGTDVWMLSGDNAITANAIGSQLGISSTRIIAGVLPSQKAEKIQYLQKTLKARTSSGVEHSTKRALIAMVGDGINDAPALTTADVGIAIGSGSDIAISSAGFVLVSSNLTSLLILLDLSKIVFRRIKFNFGWALVYNMIGLPIAAGVLYPIVSNGKHIRLDPVWASLAMAASSISVVCSSLALRTRIPGVGFRAPKYLEREED